VKSVDSYTTQESVISTCRSPQISHEGLKNV
jgi:hypothetical protein